MKIIFGVIIAFCIALHPAMAGSTQHNWFNLSWSNGIKVEGKPKANWYLNIQKEDLLEDSLCNFGERNFDPAPAINSAFGWMNSMGFETGGFRLYDITIFTMGQDWKSCVYIVELYDSEARTTMHIGVSLDGMKVYAPTKL